MSDKKMISIDQFNEAERGEVDEIFKGLMQKHRLRSGKEPDAKKEKEYTAEARQQVMTLKLAKEKAKADKAKKTPTRRKKPEAQSASEVNDFNWSASVIKGRR
ncbi:hypothetical protein QMZ30_16155 [Pantoea sp. EA-12]|uniref:hypothetical protein n=1 Tax=Pantoea sp. EA-12 TaxID=3043303 RepID=UPI00073E8DC6|nr:hypothetical protein [Pantoea sp. EA-12]MDI9222441.1 hypothetical protein [Pantoea sp. EA-12]